MVIIRPTGDLAKRMKVKLAQTGERSSTLLGDWYARDLVLDRQQYILCVSEHGRLPVILSAAPYANFPDRLVDALPIVLQKIEVPVKKAEVEVAKMDRVVLAKTASRSILGSMNEFRFQLQATKQMGRLRHDPVKMSLDLAEVISLVLPDYTPKDTVLKLFGEAVYSRSRQSPPRLSLVYRKMED